MYNKSHYFTLYKVNPILFIYLFMLRERFLLKLKISQFTWKAIKGLFISESETSLVLVLSQWIEKYMAWGQREGQS